MSDGTDASSDAQSVEALRRTEHEPGFAEQPLAGGRQRDAT